MGDNGDVFEAGKVAKVTNGRRLLQRYVQLREPVYWLRSDCSAQVMVDGKGE